MSGPLVSIIMPVYNGEKFMSRAIESVLAQSYSNWELMIIDDGSKDDSYEVALQYTRKDKRIVCLKNTGATHGANVSRNIGIKAAKGEYIAFLDCDDYYLENALINRVRFFSENEGTVIVYGNALCDSGGVKHKWIYDDVAEKSINSYLAEELSLCPQVTMMLKKQSIVEAGYLDESLKAWSDDDVVLSVAFDHNTINCGEFISVIVKGNSIMTSNKNNTYLGLKTLLKKYRYKIVKYAGFKRLLIWKIRLLAAYFYAKEYNAKDGTLSKLIYRYLHEQIRDFIRPYFRHYFE